MHILPSLFLSLSLLGLVACDAKKTEQVPESKPTQQQLRIAVVANGTSGTLDFIGVPQLISQDPIFINALKQQHIELKWEPVTTAAVATLVNESFLNNKIDFAFYGNLPAVVLNATGVRTQIVVPGGIGNNVYLVVPPDSPVKSIEDLKGKKIALHRGRPWEIKRARIMKRDKYLCQNCRRDGIATKASSVDHIIPKAHGSTDDDFNLESLCWTCHSKKTATERTR